MVKGNRKEKLQPRRFKMLTKTEIIDLVREFVQNNEADEVRALRDELKNIMKIERGDGRKVEVLHVLQERGHVSILDIAEAVGISAKNVSSQLVYLKKDGYKIATDSAGRKFLED